MKTLNRITLLSLAMAATFTVLSGCKKDVEGCTDPTSPTYNPEATVDDGSCSNDITTDVTWKASENRVLKGFVRVKAGATLTIEAGTVIKGDKDTKGTLIIERGAKVIAEGTAAKPIIFTSSQPKGSRSYGDWGGILLCGKAPINVAGGEAIVEGGTEATYGGTDAADNSGVLKYVRIEFPGIAFQPNQEINGLTLAGVGSGTTIDYVQVSYSGDDAVEFFGGTVNVKHLLMHRTWDDDFDTDLGWSGKGQFLAALRDPQTADQSGSNGFESDNDATGTAATPFTQGQFSNVSVFGPIQNVGDTTYNKQFKRGAHLRRNTKESIFNSVIVGYPVGVLVDGAGAEANATAGELQFKNNVLANCVSDLATASGSTWDILTWFQAGNNQSYVNVSSLLLNNVYNLTSPNFLPQASSPLLSGASFSGLSGFETVNYKGAFGTSDWTTGWTNFDPQQTDY